MARFFTRIGADPDLAIIYRNLVAASTAFRRAGSLVRANEVATILQDLMAAYDGLAVKTAADADRLIRQRVEATRVRPVRSGALEGGIRSIPLPTNLPAGSVGIVDLEHLDKVAPYWPVQEIGTAREEYGIRIPSQKSTFFGGPRKVVPGFFQPGSAAPDPAQGPPLNPRVHPFFQQEPYRKGMPAMNVMREIEPRHFLRDGAAAAIAQHVRDARKIDQDVLTRLGSV